jgi:hypothetical protein
VTSIGTVAFAPQIAAAAQHYALDPTLLAAVAAQETGGPGANSGANVVGGDVRAALSAYNAGSYAQLGGTARDAAIPDLADTSASVNQLQSLASSSSSAPQASAMPAPSLPTTQQQTQAQQSAAQPALKGDFYADGDDAE